MAADNALHTHLATLNDRLLRFADGVRALTGWRARLAAAGCGVASALALAPTYLIFLLAIAFPILVWLVDGASGNRPWFGAALIGWAFGYGYFLVALYWVGIAFTVDAAAHGWLIPFVAVLFPGGLALFPALAFGLAKAVWSPSVGRIFALAALFAACEWLRGTILSGFPWALIGYSWAFSSEMLQSVSLIGIYALSFITVLAASSLAVFGDRDRGRDWILPAAMYAILAAALVFGIVRLSDAGDETVDGVRIRIVQPNTAQQDKYKDELLVANWQTLLQLTKEPGLEDITHVVWPEAAPPFVLSREPMALEMIGEVLPDDAVLLTGAVRAQASERPRGDWFNSMHVISGKGEILATYDKAHLVPFGEYLPLDDLLESIGITKIVQVAGRFKSGPGPRTLEVPGAPPVGPLICYEIIFPGEVVDEGNRPQWLVNQTDDSWFGDTSGPRQHLAIARVRAIEEGLPIVRAANTGISTVIDPYGRTGEQLPYGTKAKLDSKLPKALHATLYFFTRNVTFATLVILSFGFAIFMRRLSLRRT